MPAVLALLLPCNTVIIILNFRMADSDDDVVIIENMADMDEAPPAKRQRASSSVVIGELTDYSSGIGMGVVGPEVLIVGELVNQARREKGKFPAGQTSTDFGIKPEGHPRQYAFHDDDFNDLVALDLDDVQLANYVASGNASSSRAAERRAAKVEAFKRFRAQQAQLGQNLQHSQLQLQHSTAVDDEVILIPDSDEEEDMPSYAHSNTTRHEQPAAGDAAVPALAEGPSAAPAATPEAEPASVARQRQRQQPRQQQQIATGQPASAPRCVAHTCKRM